MSYSCSPLLSNLTDEVIKEILADRTACLNLSKIRAKEEAEKASGDSEETRRDF